MYLAKDSKESNIPGKKKQWEKKIPCRDILFSQSIFWCLYWYLSHQPYFAWLRNESRFSISKADWPRFQKGTENLWSSVFWQKKYQAKIYHLQKRSHGMGKPRMKAVCNWTLCSAAVYTMWYWTVRHPTNPNSSRQLGSKWLLKNAGDLDLNKLEYP